MKKKFLLLTLFFALGLYNLLFANINFKIENYSYKDGLNTSNANSTFKDSKGFLWLCSVDGVFRYDGYSFRNLNTFIKDTFNIESICIIEDKYGNFLIGTIGKGIYYYNIYSERIYPVKLDIQGNINITKIEIFQNKIWLATNIGLIIIDNPVFDQNILVKTRLLLPNPSDINSPNNSINVLMFMPDGNSLWVGSNGSLFELNISTYEFKDVNPYPQNSIRCFFRYSKNMIIAGSWDGGIFGINTAKKEIQNDPFITEINKYVRSDRIIDVFVDTKKRIWIATFGNGLYIFEKDKQGNITYNHYKNDKEKGNIKSDFIHRLYVDSSDIGWLCMSQPALSKIYFPRNEIEFIHLEDGNDIGEIMSVNQSIDKDKLWVATLNNIYIFNTLTKQSKQITVHSDINQTQRFNNITNCIQDSRGNLWIVDRRSGLFLIPAKHSLLAKDHIKELFPIDANDLLLPDKGGPYINVLFEDSKERIWIGSWGNLFVIDIKPGFSNAQSINDLVLNSNVTNIYSVQNRKKFNFPVVPIFSRIEKAENQFWVGTSNIGIIRFEETKNSGFNGTLVPFNTQLPGKNIKCLFKDKTGNIWIGTNAGLCVFEQNTGNLKIFTTKNGLATDNINNIIEDSKKNIWVSTPYGISKVNPSNNTINNYLYSRQENLNQYIPNAVTVNSKGMLFFSSKETLAAIDPSKSENLIEQHGLFFTDIKIDNRKVIPNELFGGVKIIENNINKCSFINVPYNHSLTIEFASIDFVSPEQKLYKYRIGKNKEWVILNSNQRSLVLPAMSPGEYTLEVMLANYSDNEPTRSIRINYLPPYWQSKPALVLYAIVLLLLFFIYRKLTIQKIQKDSIIEQERYERKKLEELDAMKSEFFSNISHELRTPLSLIVNPIEKLSGDSEIANNKKEKLRLALKSCYRLLRLINELLDFSKIEKKLLEPEFRYCEIVPFIYEICAHFNDLALSKNIEYKINSPFEKIHVPIDNGMIEKVVYNILSNAFKYTPKNGAITVNLNKSYSNTSEYLKVSVTNTGEGISKEFISKVFDKYYQVNNYQNKKTKGTGIGLALVKSYMDLHNGFIELRSDPGKETCFDLFLPLIQENCEITVKNELNGIEEIFKYNSSGRDQNTHKPTSHYSLLLVEDDDEIRNYLAEELSFDFKVINATNGEEGLKLANEIIPDLIISDIVMPVMSGIEMCKKIKSNILTSHIPFVLLSARTTVPQQIEGLESGADVYIPKPFNLTHLRVQILRLINLKETVYSRYLKENTLIPSESLNTELDKEFMQKIITYIEKNLTNPTIEVEQLASHVSLSRAQTYRKVKAISGMSIVQFIRTVRLKKAAQLVSDKQLNFTEIAYETGFSTPAYFTKCFRDHFGKPPSEFVEGFK